jgi:hypothetical protein
MNELEKAFEIIRNIKNDSPRNLVRCDDLSDALQALKEVTRYAEMHHCSHEETYRGGFIWEICSQCGMKWADDEGGMPEDAGALPDCLNKAYDVLSKNGM